MRSHHDAFMLLYFMNWADLERSLSSVKTTAWTSTVINKTRLSLRYREKESCFAAPNIIFIMLHDNFSYKACAMIRAGIANYTKVAITKILITIIRRNLIKYILPWKSRTAAKASTFIPVILHDGAGIISNTAISRNTVCMHAALMGHFRVLFCVMNRKILQICIYGNLKRGFWI